MRILAWIGLALAAVLLLGLGVLLVGFDATGLGTTALARLSSAEGTEATLQQARFSLGDGLTLTGVEVEAAAPSGALSGAFEQIDLAVDWLPLLGGTVEIRELALRRPRIELVIDPEAEFAEGDSGAGVPLRLAAADIVEGSLDLRLVGVDEPILEVEALAVELRDVTFDPAAASPALGLQGRGSLGAERITAAGYVFDTIEGVASLDGGVFTGDGLSAAASFGRFDLPTARFDLSTAEPSFELAATAADVNLDELLGSSGESLGNAAMELSLRGQGTAPGWLDGSGSLDFAGGSLPAVPILVLLDEALGTRIASIEYEPATIRFQISDAALGISPFELRSEAMRLQGGGRVLADGVIDMQLSVSVPRVAATPVSIAGPMLDALTDEDQWTTFPALVRGTLEDPAVSLDMDAIQAAVLAQAQNSLGDRIRRGIGRLIRRQP